MASDKSSLGESKKFTRVKNPHHIIRRLVINGDPSMIVLFRKRDHLTQVRCILDTNHIRPRFHNFFSCLVIQFDNFIEDFSFGALDHTLLVG